MRALVADDSKTMRKIVMRTLNSSGIDDVQEAGDGAEAIQRFEQSEFDLVVTDWNMPERSGLEVVQAIRQLDAETPVVMVTTQAERDHIMEAIQAGVTEYLVKPFTAESRVKLSNLVRKLFNRRLYLAGRSDLDVAVVNPFLAATVSVFRSMLNCELTAGSPYNLTDFRPLHDVSGVVHLNGNARGKLVLSLSREAARAAMIPVAARHPAEIDAEVIDLVLELTNVIVGNALGEFDESTLTFGAPEIVVGRTRCIDFPQGATPVGIPFESPHGPVAVQVGLRCCKRRSIEEDLAAFGV